MIPTDYENNQLPYQILQIKNYIEKLGNYSNDWSLSKALFLDELKKVIKEIEEIPLGSVDQIKQSIGKMDQAINLLRFIEPKIK